MKWVVTCTSATPPMFHELREGKKTIALVRRVAGRYVTRKGAQVYQHHYQVVRKFVGPLGAAIGPVFPSLAAAKKYAGSRA